MRRSLSRRPARARTQGRKRALANGRRARRRATNRPLWGALAGLLFCGAIGVGLLVDSGPELPAPEVQERDVQESDLAASTLLESILPDWSFPDWELDPRAWLRRPALTLRSIEVLGLNALEAEGLVERAGLRSGVPLVDVDLAAVTESIASHPRVASCRGASLPPDRLLLEVEERVPVAALGDGGEGFDASGERFALAPHEAASLPSVEGDPQAALPLLMAARSSGTSVAAVRAAGPDEVRFRPARGTYWIRVGRDAARSIADYERLAWGGYLDGLAADEIDLRFRGNAVLRGDGATGPDKGG